MSGWRELLGVTDAPVAPAPYAQGPVAEPGAVRATETAQSGSPNAADGAPTRGEAADAIDSRNRGTEPTEPTQCLPSEDSVPCVGSVRASGDVDNVRAVDVFDGVAVVVSEAAPFSRRCADCRHDVRSAVNPAGGLTSCVVRNDVPLMVSGSRRLSCGLFEAAGGVQ